MTVCCDSSPMSVVSSPYSSRRATDENVNRRKVPCKRFRSTKGASKARRDHINAEIRSMRDLLPISQDDQERLSYLHSMSAICIYVRKSLYFQGLRQREGGHSSDLYEGFLQALPGFIVAMTKEGKLIYVSENVDEYLGFSMVDILQGDSFYSMLERKEVNMVKSHLEDHCSAVLEKAFVCQMHISKSFRVRHGGSCTMLVRGRFQSIPQSSAECPDLDRVFVALCTPTLNRLKDDILNNFTQNFRTTHQPNMAFIQACDSVPFFLGYSSGDLVGQSWYNLLHPDDLVLGIEAHKILLQINDGAPVEMVLRLQCRDLSWKRLYIRATKDSGMQTVTCTNHVISSEAEAEFLVQKIYTDIQVPSRCTHLQSSTGRPVQPHICLSQVNSAVVGLKRQRLPSSLSEQPQNKTNRLLDHEESSIFPANQACDKGCSPAGHQGEMSPTSSHSPTPSFLPSTQEEEVQSDFPLDICDYAEDLRLLQEGLPSYLSFQDSHCGPSDPHPTSETLQPIIGHGFPMSDISESCHSPSPSYDFPSCPADARLVPDCLPMPAVYEGLSDCTFHLEALIRHTYGPRSAGSYFTPLADAAALVTSDPSLSPMPGIGGSTFPYSEKEQQEISILARQISSLASSFNMYRSADQARILGSRYKKASPDSNACSSVSDWSHLTPHPVKPEVVLDESIIDSILKDLDRVSGVDLLSYSGPISSCGAAVTIGRSSDQSLALGAAAADVLSFTAQVEDLSHEQPLGSATAQNRPILATRLQGNIELNQLNHFLHRDRLQGKFPVRCAQV